MKGKGNLSLQKPRLPQPLPEAQPSAHTALGLCHPLHPLKDFLAFRNLSGNCHHHCAGWQMSPQRESGVYHTLQGISGLRQRRGRGEGGWLRRWFSPGAGDSVSPGVRWGARRWKVATTGSRVWESLPPASFNQLLGVPLG